MIWFQLHIFPGRIQSRCYQFILCCCFLCFCHGQVRQCYCKFPCQRMIYSIIHYIYIYIFHYIPLCIPLYIFVILNCVKSVRIQSFSGPHFPAFRLNREIYFVNFRVQSESRKIWTRKTTITDSFYSVFKLDLHLFGQDHSKTSNNEIFIQTFLRSNKLHKQMT